MTHDTRTRGPEIRTPAVEAGATYKTKERGKRFRFLKRALEEQPSMTANLFTAGSLVTFVSVAGGFGVGDKVKAAILSGDATGALIVGETAIYALLVGTAIMSLKEVFRASQHDRRQAEGLTEVQEEISRLDLERTRDRRTFVQGVEMIADKIDTLSIGAVNAMKDKHLVRNEAPIWANVASASTYYAVCPQARFDVTWERGPDGNLRAVADPRRLSVWVHRYSDRGVSRANIVFLEERPEAEGVVPAQLATYIAAFRAVKTIAQARMSKLRLERIRFYIRYESGPGVQSFFVGKYSLGEQQIEFVNSYSDFARMYQVPKTLIDGDVETTHSPDAVAKYRNLAEVLMASSTVYTYEEIEAKFGHLVEDPYIDPHQMGRVFGDLVDDEDDFEEEFVVHDDHFAINRRRRYVR